MICSTDFSISHGGKNDLTKHVTRKHHQEMARAGTSSQSLVSFCTPQQRAIEAEARWAIFTAKHNIAFLTSDYATKLFCKMFPDSVIAKKFVCGRTKTTAIVKEALVPHFSGENGKKYVLPLLIAYERVQRHMLTTGMSKNHHIDPGQKLL